MSWLLILLVLGVPAPAPAAAPEPAPAPAPDLALLFRDACLWEVGSNTEKVQAARAALVALGEPALSFLIPAQLDTEDTLVTRALAAVITGIGGDAAARLLPCLESERPGVRRNAADLLGSLGAVDAAPAIARLLSDPDARLGALKALAALKSEAAVPDLVALLESDAPERVRVTAVTALGETGGARAEAALVRQLCQGSAPLGFAAELALARSRSSTALRALLADPEPIVRLHAIAALGQIGDALALRDVLPFLEDESAVVRGFAAEALGPVLDSPLTAVFRERVATETVPFAVGKLREALDR